jgi:diaminohydroxyphosphoribosylaminopyrimidine deaminase/5-amino-6-(5-phosphoribosylamino)uracil reductase
VVWTRSAKLPRQSILFTDEHRERTIVLKGLSLRAALKDLGQRGIQSVLIEGGSHLLGEAFDRQLVDEVCFYLAPLLTGGPVPAVGGKGAPAVAFAQRLEGAKFKRIGGDVRLTGKIAR